jgi:putative transposase
MWKIFWPNAESLFLMKPSDNGAGNSDPTMPDVLRRNREASVISGRTLRQDLRQQQYLWRAVDQDGDVIDILLQSRRDQRSAERLLRRLLRGQGKEPFRMITDKSYAAASRTILSGVTHDTQQYANNRVEISHQPTRMRERQMRRFKSPRQAQRFLSLHGVVRNLFCVGRHLLRSTHHRLLRARPFEVWRSVTAA